MNDRDLPQPSDIRLEIHNFRAFRESSEIRLAPLTLLVGRNSSGKSSIVSMLLLLKQSVEQQPLSSRVTPLLLNGPLCNLGSYEDVVYGHNENDSLQFSFTIDLGDVESPFSYRMPLVEIDVPRTIISPRLRRWWREDSKKKNHGTAQLVATFATDEPFGPSLSRLEIAIQGLGELSLVRTEGSERRQHWRVYSVSGIPKRTLGMRFTPGWFFPMLYERREALRQTKASERSRVTRFVHSYHAVSSFLSRCVEQLALVGPFRTPPDRRYQYSGNTINSVGMTGEQAVELLIIEQLIKKQKNERHLHHAVSFWLRHLGMASDLRIDALSKRANLFELNVANAGHARVASIADVGYGVSQILPVLIQGMTLGYGDTYIVQQPEIHLHPDAQAALMDFFIYLASQGIRVIVETHSEHLLVRARRRLAERSRVMRVGLASERPGTRDARISRDWLSVLFVGGKRGDGASVQELAIDDAFQFEKWPKGFMSQTFDDRRAILKAVARGAR